MDETVNEDSIVEGLEPIEETSAGEPQAEQDNNGGNSAVEEASEKAEQEVASEPAESTQNESQTGDADLDNFLQSKGLNKDDPDLVNKVIGMYRGAEKLMNKKSQQTAQLERQLSAQRFQSPDQTIELESRMNAMQTEMDTERWKQANHITPETEQKMVEYISQPITDRYGRQQMGYDGQPLTKANLVLTGALSLDDVYKMVGGNQEDASSVKQEMQKAIQNEMAAKQIAQRPTAGTTDSTKFSKPNADDPFLEGLMGD